MVIGDAGWLPAAGWQAANGWLAGRGWLPDRLLRHTHGIIQKCNKLLCLFDDFEMHFSEF